jgi:adenine C2-methylase RlmN of 23S rRNA A2503 and tRNA A37
VLRPSPPPPSTCAQQPTPSTVGCTATTNTRACATQARELAALLRRHNLTSHVNLIPWNPVSDASFQRPGSKQVKAFQQVLEAAALPVSVRTTRGLEAAAACGQLRNDFQKAALANPQPLQ